LRLAYPGQQPGNDDSKEEIKRKSEQRFGLEKDCQAGKKIEYLIEMRGDIMTKFEPDTNNRRASFIAALVTFMIAFTALPAAAETGAGASGASFLSLPVGARSIALGETGVAFPRDPFTWLSNPALMPFAERSGVGAFHSQWTLDTYYDNFIAKRALSRTVSIGAAFTYLSSPDIPGFDDLGAPTADVGNNNLQGIVGVGFEPLPGFGAGVNVKYLQEKIADWTGRGWAVDVGAAWNTGVREIALGAAVQNLGSDITYIAESEKLPTAYRVGASGAIPFPVPMVKARIAADLVKERFEDAYVCYGAEIDVRSIVFLRAGYTADTNREGNRFSVGGGLNLFERLMLDYAWTPYGDLGSFHRISIFVH
jgi:hypothetical protein